MSPDEALRLGLRCLLAIVLATAGAAKLAAGWRSLAPRFELFRRPRWLSARAVVLFAVAGELLASGLLVTPLYRWGAALALCMAVVFFNEISRLLALRLQPLCPCFGSWMNVGVGWRLWAVDLLMIAVATWLVRPIIGGKNALTTLALTSGLVALTGTALQTVRQARVVARARRLGGSGLEPGQRVPPVEINTESGSTVNARHFSDGPVALFFLREGCRQSRRILGWFDTELGRRFAEQNRVLLVMPSVGSGWQDGVYIDPRQLVSRVSAEVARAVFRIDHVPAIVRTRDGTVDSTTFLPDSVVLAADAGWKCPGSVEVGD